MNQNGFGLREVIVFLVIIAACVAIIFFGGRKIMNKISDFSLSFKVNSAKTILASSDLIVEGRNYPETENNISEKSIFYFSRNMTNEKPTLVTIEQLVEQEYIYPVYAKEDKSIRCTGYVEMTNNIPKAYLRCGKEYTTKNYNIYKEINY